MFRKLFGLSEDMTPIDFVLTRSGQIKVKQITFVNVSALFWEPLVIKLSYFTC